MSLDNAWDVYLELLGHFESIEDEDDIRTVIREVEAIPEKGKNDEEQMALLPLRPFRYNALGVVGAAADAPADHSDDDGSEVSHNEWTDESSEGSAVDPESDIDDMEGSIVDE